MYIESALRCSIHEVIKGPVNVNVTFAELSLLYDKLWITCDVVEHNRIAMMRQSELTFDAGMVNSGM